MHNVSSDGTQMNGMCNKSNMFILHVKDNFQFIIMSNSFLGCSLVVCYKAILFYYPDHFLLFQSKIPPIVHFQWYL